MSEVVDPRLAGVTSLLLQNEGAAFTLVIDDSGRTATHISAGHTLKQVVYAALFLLLYAEKMAEDDEEVEIADCLDEAVDCLAEGGFGFSEHDRARPLN